MLGSHDVVLEVVGRVAFAQYWVSGRSIAVYRK